MLTNIKVCGKYQQQNGIRAMPDKNGKKPKTEKIFQKHKSKFVEDLDNKNYLEITNDDEEDTNQKEEDFEEFMDKYSLEYNDVGEDSVASADGVDGAPGADGVAGVDGVAGPHVTPKLPKDLEIVSFRAEISIESDDNDLENTDEKFLDEKSVHPGDTFSSIETEFPIEISTNFGISSSKFPVATDFNTKIPIEISTTKLSEIQNPVTVPMEDDNFLNTDINIIDSTTDDLFSDYQTEDISNISMISEKNYLSNEPPITTIFPQKHERKTISNEITVVSVYHAKCNYFEKPELFYYV